MKELVTSPLGIEVRSQAETQALSRLSTYYP